MGLSSDLAGAFQIILAQQEAEARKEERQQATALTLLTMEMRSQERLEEREWKAELTEESREWQLNTILLQDARSRALDARSTYNDLAGQYSETAGKLPNMSSNTRSILNSTYEGDMDSVKDIITFYDDQTVELEREGKRLSSQLYQTGVEAKKEYAERFPQYVSANVEDAIIDPVELDMLTSDLKKEANENTLRAIASQIKTLESGDRANRTNNPGAMIYAPWQEEYGAIKKEENAFWQYIDSDGKTKEVFSEDAIPEDAKASKYYTSEFPDKVSGESALNQLVSDIWTKSEGDPLKFAESYSGLKPGTEEFKSYSKAIESINLIDTSDLLASKITEDYYKTPIESRIAAGETYRLSQAENEKERAGIGFDLMVPYIENHNFLKLFGRENTPGRTAVEVALRQGSTEAFYYYIQNHPEIGAFIKDKLKNETGTDARLFKSYYNQAMKGMDKSINLRFPGQNVSLKDTIEDKINVAGSVDSALMEFMTLTQGSGLSREQREDAYDDFLDSMTKKWGAGVEAELDSIMQIQVNELSTLDSLNNIKRMADEASNIGRLRSGGL